MRRRLPIHALVIVVFTRNSAASMNTELSTCVHARIFDSIPSNMSIRLTPFLNDFLAL